MVDTAPIPTVRMLPEVIAVSGLSHAMLIELVPSVVPVAIDGLFVMNVVPPLYISHVVALVVPAVPTEKSTMSL